MPSSSNDAIGLEVRRATPADYPAIADLTVAAYEADGQITAQDNPYRAALADVATRAAAGEVLVAVRKGEVVGSVLFVLAGSRYAELAEPGQAEFRMLAVSPQAQRQGVGEALVRACVERARANNAGTIIIAARDFVAAPQRLYARLGFVRMPELDFSPVPEVRLLVLRYDVATEPAAQREASA